MVLSRLELETYSYQKYTLPIKLKNHSFQEESNLYQNINSISLYHWAMKTNKQTNKDSYSRFELE
jgi:hypothetical protein